MAKVSVQKVVSNPDLYVGAVVRTPDSHPFPGKLFQVTEVDVSEEDVAVFMAGSDEAIILQINDDAVLDVFSY